jgi:hypothetical protein
LMGVVATPQPGVQGTAAAVMTTLLPHAVVHFTRG